MKKLLLGMLLVAGCATDVTLIKYPTTCRQFAHDHDYTLLLEREHGRVCRLMSPYSVDEFDVRVP